MSSEYIKGASDALNMIRKFCKNKKLEAKKFNERQAEIAYETVGYKVCVVLSKGILGNLEVENEENN
ncbi:MAG TPA: hypothetical protein VKZ42_00460 [Flavobacteriaceae bacterium]|nr:hypothetical protein [Flavobacteriaceae bacterium]